MCVCVCVCVCVKVCVCVYVCVNMWGYVREYIVARARRHCRVRDVL